MGRKGRNGGRRNKNKARGRKGRNGGRTTRNIAMGKNGGMVEEGIGIWRGGRNGRNFGRRKRRRGFFVEQAIF